MGHLMKQWLKTLKDRPWVLWSSWLKYSLLALCTMSLCLGLPARLSAQTPSPSNTPVLAQAAQAQGQQLYEAGRYTEAADVLQRAIATASQPADKVGLLRNLALVYRQLGQWQAAETTLKEGFSLLTGGSVPAQTNALRAALLDVQGSLQLDQGQGEAAIGSWDQAAILYSQLNQPEKALRARINQAEAMQRLGFHRQVTTTLTPLVTANQPNSLLRAAALRTLGDSLIQTGDFKQAQKVLEASLAIATELQEAAAISAANLSLGAVLEAQGSPTAALVAYQKAINPNIPAALQVQVQLNRLRLLTKTGNPAAAQALWPDILATLETLLPTQSTLFAQINLAETLISLPPQQRPNPRQIADLLATTLQQAQTLQDKRSESYAQGTLARLYEQQEQWSSAQSLSEQALSLAQSINARDITYRWQWQLGRVYKAQKQTEKAIAAYTDAVDTLKVLRTDLVAVNPAVQVSFQDSVEPIHRELVSLLLAPERQNTRSEDVEKARKTIEALQLAELDNFFREACLDAAAVDIDRIDQRAAVIYPIILPERLEVIVSLPNQPLTHYTSAVSADQLEQTVRQLRQALTIRVGNRHLAPAQQLYRWMIQPAATAIAESKADTLVFVLDGVLRNVPIATLHTGQQFLIEQYSVALTPGLQLLNPKPIQDQPLKVLTAGLSEPRQGFSALPNVVSEVETIQATVPADVLLNNTFTVAGLKQSLATDAAPIVHLATHGKFSSSRDDTFVLTWDDRLDIDSLNNLLQIAELNEATPIELLVLSACQTAVGDKQAALGLAGMAVRSGARSTIATLWQVNDEATAMLMIKLYEVLATKQTTKAEALRLAQLEVLKEPKFRQHPFFWAPYVLVGNWL